MKSRRLFFVVLLCVFCGRVLADGMFYAPGKPPTGIPYQRALIVFDGEREILLVQSQVPPAVAPAAGPLGWVVPVPSVPEVGTLDAAAADRVFAMLGDEVTSRRPRSWVPAFAFAVVLSLAIAWMVRRDLAARRRDGSRPSWASYVPVVYYLLPSLAYLAAMPPWKYVTRAEEEFFIGMASTFVAVSFLGGLAVWFIHLLVPFWRKSPTRTIALMIGAIPFFTVVLAGLVGILLGPLFSSKGVVAAAAPARVKVVSHAAFGALDVKVIAATPAGDGGAVVEWLNANGFAFDRDAAAAFDAHVKRGWVFAVARLTAAPTEPDAGHGLSPPLLLRFPVKDAVYPLALTATAGVETRVDLFTLTTFPPGPATYLQRHHAAALRRIGSAGELLGGARSTGWLTKERWTESWVGHYASRLTPEQMAEDFVLRREVAP